MNPRFGLRRVAAGAGRAFRSLLVFGSAILLTILTFLILPLIQQATKPPGGDTEIRQVSTVNLPPPPPPPPEEEERKEEEQPPPQLSEPEAIPLDLSELELALNPGMGGDGMGGDFGVRLLSAAEGKSADDADAIFSLSDLDQTPRVVYQPAPEYPADMKRKKMQGTVHILFLVDAGGAVQNPIVQKSTHPAFDRPALQAIRKWRFEPGKRNGQAVQFKMKVPVTFATG